MLWSRISPLTLLFATVTMAIIFVSAPKLFIKNSDGPWHIASGEYLLEKISQGDGFPYQDPFSFTPASEKWINPAWFYDVVLAAVGKYAGIGFCVLLIALLTAGLVAMMCEHLLRRGIPPVAVCLGLFFHLSLLATGVAIRPQIMTLYGAAITYGLLYYSRENLRLLWGLPLVFLMWSNLHGGFPVGFLVMAVFGAEALLSKQWRYFQHLLCAGIISLIMTFSTPYRWEMYELIYRTMTGVMVPYIQEWGSPFHAGQWQNITVYIILFLVCIPRRKIAVPLSDALLFLAALAMAVQSIRHISVLGVLGAPLFCYLLAGRLQPFARYQAYQVRFEKWLTGEGVKRHTRTLFYSVMACMCVGALLWPKWEEVLMPARSYPIAEYDFLISHYEGCRTYAFYDYGGTLLYRSQGKVPVFFDSRAENVYSQQVLADGIHIATLQSGWQHLLNKYGVEAVLMPKEHPIAAKLAHAGGWKKVLDGDHATLWVRNEIAEHPERCGRIQD